jgi:hypothetical protein
MMNPKFAQGQVVVDEFGRTYDVVEYVRPNVVAVSNQLTKSDRIVREMHEDFLSPWSHYNGKQDFGKF